MDIQEYSRNNIYVRTYTRRHSHTRERSRRKAGVKQEYINIYISVKQDYSN